MSDDDDEVELTEEQEQRRDQMIEALLRADFDEVAAALASWATGGKTAFYQRRLGLLTHTRLL